MNPQAKAGILAAIIMLLMSIGVIVITYVAYRMINDKKPKTKKQLIDECIRNHTWICVREVSLLTGIPEDQVGDILANDPRTCETASGCIRGEKRTRLFKIR